MPLVGFVMANLLTATAVIERKIESHRLVVAASSPLESFAQRHKGVAGQRVSPATSQEAGIHAESYNQPQFAVASYNSLLSSKGQHLTSVPIELESKTATVGSLLSLRAHAFRCNPWRCIKETACRIRWQSACLSEKY